MPISVFLFKRYYTLFWFTLCFLNFCPSRLVKYAFLIYCFSIFCFACHDLPINDTFWVTILTFHILIEDWTSFVNPLRGSQKSQFYSFGKKKSDISRKWLFAERQDHLTCVTISVGVSKLSNTPTYFVKPVVMVNHSYYDSQVLRYMIPQMHKVSKNLYLSSRRYKVSYHQGYH